MNARVLNTRHTRRGAVLLLVLGAVAILSILAVELAHRANLDVARSARRTRESSFRNGIDSALEITKAQLFEGRPNTTFDSLNELWNRSVDTTLASGEKLSIRIADEAGKINILKAIGSDALAKKTRISLARLFSFLAKTEPKRAAQWTAAEAAILMRLKAADISATAMVPIYTLDGLRESGLSSEMVFGGLEHEPWKNQWALSDLLTTFGDGRVNLNTAPAPVLYALDEEFDEALVAAIDRWRSKVDIAGQQGGQPFETAQALEKVTGVVESKVINGNSQLTKNLFLKVQDRVTVQGKIFSARVTVSVNGRSRQAWGFLEAAGGAIPEVRMLALEEIEP